MSSDDHVVVPDVDFSQHPSLDAFLRARPFALRRLWWFHDPEARRTIEAIFMASRELVGEQVDGWLTTPNLAFGGLSPVAIIDRSDLSGLEKLRTKISSALILRDNNRISRS